MKQPVFLAPTILTHATASATFNCIERRTPEMTLHGLQDLASKHRIITVAEVPDNNEVNRRKRAFTDRLLPANVLVTTTGCNAHLLWRVICSSIQETDIIGDCHAVFLVTRHPSRKDALARAARELIEGQFDWLPGPPPDPHWAAHADSILQHTLLRTQSRVRGVLCRPLHGEVDADADGVVDEIGTSRPDQRRDAIAAILKYCNDDPRSLGRFRHFCNGCCASYEEARDNYVAAVIGGGLLGGLVSQTPSKGRHGSATEALGEQAAGDMFFGILRRSFNKAFPGQDRAAVDEDEGDDARKYMKSKTRRACAHLADRRDRIRGAVVAWLAEPLDHLWRALQYLDDRASLIIDLQCPHVDPFAHAVRGVSAVLFETPAQGPLATIVNHYQLAEADGMWLSELVQTTVASMLCQMHYRFALKFSTWPWKLAKIVDARATRAEKESVAREFWHEPECCLDDDFSLKLRRMCTTWTDVLDEAWLQSALLLWARHTRLSNMHVERLLARMKCSCGERCPDIQRLVCTSLLTQWLHEHRSAGGADPRGSAKRRALLAQGVPLRARRTVRKVTLKRPTGLRGVMTFIQRSMAKGRRGQAFRKAEKRALYARYRAISAEERLPYVLLEQHKEPDNAETPSESYERRIGTTLSGLSSQELQRARSIWFTRAFRCFLNGVSWLVMPMGPAQRTSYA